MSEPVEAARLPSEAPEAIRAELARLRTLLDAHGIDWRPAPIAPTPAASSSSVTHLSTSAKVALFRRLFHGRNDCYALRWESLSTGKSGYAPACSNEWRTGICEKPRIKCSACQHRSLLPVTDEVIYDHLAGTITVGIYPLLPDNNCHFLAVDFDQAEWAADISAFAEACRDVNVPVALEVSRSGTGAHAWIFFTDAVPARDARQLGSALLSYTCARTRQLSLSSYDRLFPNQDTMPAGGFGNLIALPLQKRVRDRGCSVFVDETLRPFDNQWDYLASVQSLQPQHIADVIHRATGSRPTLDVPELDTDHTAEPWRMRTAGTISPDIPLPSTVRVTHANQLFINTDGMPQALLNRVIRLAAFANPAYFEAQSMRRSVWNIPRLIAMAERFPSHIGLPRGCEDAMVALCDAHHVRIELDDQRQQGATIDARFTGTLRAIQERAVVAMLAHDTGVLCAPTAFGKTVVAAAMIAARPVSTLVLVHRAALMEQWRQRLRTFLNGTDGTLRIGQIGAGKMQHTGGIDVAVMQSLVRRGEVNPLVESYGHVIVDECHHVSAVSVTAILRRVRARFVTGLTATPERRDGLQALVFMQCGPIRHRVTPSASQPTACTVLVTRLPVATSLSSSTEIQTVFRAVAADTARTDTLIALIARAWHDGRKVLVLTERTAHVEALRLRIIDSITEPIVLCGRMSARARATQLAKLDALATDAPRIVLATGKLIGEGFDHAPLDTLVLAMPVSWRGILQQYVGRLHRDHAGKTDVRVHDLVDTGHPSLERMWTKRQRGYRALGYRIEDDA